jgi:hypothetical protein
VAFRIQSPFDVNGKSLEIVWHLRKLLGLDCGGK